MERIDPDQIFHVIPLNDLNPHDSDGLTCAFRSRVEQHGEGLLVIHNSWDGREILERALDELPKANN